MDCSSCPKKLAQGNTNSIDGVNAMLSVTYTSDANNCVIPNIQCFSNGTATVPGPFNVTIEIQHNIGYILGQGCGTVIMPPNIVVCNAQGMWVSTLDDETATVHPQPVIICSEPMPNPTTACTPKP